MKIKRNGALFLMIIVIHIVCLIMIAVLTRSTDIGIWMIRIGALIGSTLIFYTILMSLFLRQITKNFGTTFINIHHFFAISGIGIIIFHGFSYIAYYLSNNFLLFIDQLLELWVLPSILAITLIVIGIIAVILRKKMKSLWRSLHALNYIAFALITFHAILINTDVQTPAIFGIYLGMLIVVLIAFILKRQRAAKSVKKIQRTEKIP